MSEKVEELKVTKRINPERIGRVLKQNRETMMTMDEQTFQSLIHQAEIDSRRCAEASETLRTVARELNEVMLMAYEVATDRRIRIK